MKKQHQQKKLRQKNKESAIELIRLYVPPFEEPNLVCFNLAEKRFCQETLTKTKFCLVKKFWPNIDFLLVLCVSLSVSIVVVVVTVSVSVSTVVMEEVDMFGFGVKIWVNG